MLLLNIIFFFGFFIASFFALLPVLSAFFLTSGYHLFWSIPLSCIFIPFFMLIPFSLLSWFLPPLKPGKYSLFDASNKEYIFWTLRRVSSQFYLTLFQPILFLNSFLQIFILRALGAYVHRTAHISTNSQIMDPNLLYLGKKSVLGEKTILASSLVPKNGVLKTGTIRIGDFTVLGGLSKVGPGTNIGNHVFIQADVSISKSVEIKDHVFIGAMSCISSYVVIENNVNIGTNCIIPPHTLLKEGTNIPDNTILRPKSEPSEEVKIKKPVLWT